jgi:hypothetical protein
MQDHQTLLTPQAEAEMAMDAPTKIERSDYHQFLDWCRFYSIAMPADASDVGGYLLELLEHGYSLRQIRRAANSIVNFYERRRYFIDRIVVRRALALAEAQLSPKRVLN